MSAILTLEDGRVLWRSTLVMAGVYSRIAAAVGDDFPELKRWLADMSKRPAPFNSFDVRGLSPAHRAEFHRAARAAVAAASQPEVPADALRVLVRMRESIDRGEAPLTLSDDNRVHPDPGITIDVGEVWDS